MFGSLLCLAILEICTGKNMPVLLMDHDKVLSHRNLDPNPFATLSADFFTELILDAVKRTECIIIFTEETLCTEDISLRDKLGTPFRYLHEGLLHRKTLYLPSVSEPYNSLRQVFNLQPFNTFHLGFGEKLTVSNQYYKHLYIYFQDAPKVSRSEVLREHDLIMKEVYFRVRQLKAGSVVAFYTGKVNPVTMEQPKYVPESEKRNPKERGVLVATPGALFRLNGVFLSLNNARRSSFDQTPEVEIELRTRRTLNTTMQYSDFHLQFNFEFEKKRWKLANVVLLEAGDEVGRTETAVSAPWERSYYCAEPITIFNKRDGSFITLSEYQVICMWGVLMLFNCGSNSKFDDPNQKPLVIAQEAGGG